MSRRFVTGLFPGDAEKWSNEAQDQLFRQVHDIHPGVCHRLLNMIPSMNGTSLNFLKIAITVPWSEVIYDDFIKMSMYNSDEMMVLYSKQEDFRQWTLNQKCGAELLRQLDELSAEWK